MLDLYNRTAKRLTENHLAALTLLQASAATIAITECLQQALQQAGIKAETEWEAGNGCKLRLRPPHPRLKKLFQSEIEKALLCAGFGMVTSSHSDSWALINTDPNHPQHTITLIIEEH